jgi:hypothetical protein
MTSPKRALALFAAPGQEMAGVAAQPSRWFPLTLTLALAVIGQVWYFQIVDLAYAADYAVSTNRNRARLPDAQRARVAAGMSHSSLLGSG